MCRISQVKNDVGVDLNMTNISQLKRWKLAEEGKIAVLLLRSMFIVKRSIIRVANQQALDHENFPVVSRKEWKCSVICLNKGEGESLICVLGLERASPV